MQIGGLRPGDAEHTGTPIALHNSMTTLAASMFNGTINPGQLAIVRTIRTDSDCWRHRYRRFFGDRSDYTFSATRTGTVIVFMP